MGASLRARGNTSSAAINIMAATAKKEKKCVESSIYQKMASAVSDQIFIWGTVADLFYLIAIDTVHVNVIVSRSLESYLIPIDIFDSQQCT